MHDKIKTGVAGLDEILDGGIPTGHTVMVTGSCGTGKTILCSQFLFSGARNNENGLFLSLGEPKEKFIKNIEDFTFFDKKLVDTNKVRIIDITQDARLKGLEMQNVSGLINLIKSLVQDTESKRVVIDSITTIAGILGTEQKVREFIFDLGLQLSYLGCTLLFTAEIPPQKFIYSVFGVEEFIADGLIYLSEFERKGDLIRALQVIKMRGVNHSRNKHVVKITQDGINLIPLFKAGME